jgi:hypothetical protein
MTLNRLEFQAITKLQGVATFIVTAGDRVIIKTGPDGEEVLVARVPEGKEWAVSVGINIIETDS